LHWDSQYLGAIKAQVGGTHILKTAALVVF
jgi:hypothetical protein